MPSDPINNPIRAAVLSATLSFEPRPTDLLELRVSPIRFVMPRITPPLDLDAAYFRYRIDRDGLVQVLPAIAGARVCRGQLNISLKRDEFRLNRFGIPKSAGF